MKDFGPQEFPSRASRSDADVIVIGAGPAGMAAATMLALSGQRVIVLDMQPTPGGQIFRALEPNIADRPGTDTLLQALGPAYRAGQALIARFRVTPGIDYRPLTTVWELRADGTVGWLDAGGAGYLRARHVVVACGAMERPAPFPGWTLPGVMTAGAVQTLLKAGRLRPGGRIVLAGTGPLIFLLADQLRRLGVKPVLIARTDRLRDKIRALPRLHPGALPAVLKGLIWLARLRLAGVAMRIGITDLKAHGQDRVEAVSLTVAGRSVTVPCDLLVVHDGVVPAIDLAHGAGLALDWCEADKSWRPRTDAAGKAEAAPGPALTEGPCRLYVTGDARRIGGADAAIAHGRLVAATILAGAGTPSAAKAATDADRALIARPFIDTAFPPGLSAPLPSDDTLICRCEEVTAGTLRQAIRTGATDMNQIRGTLRCGMGPCQGRNCAVTLARILHEETPGRQAIPHPFRARAPVRPVPLGALARLTNIDPVLAQIVSLDDKPEALAAEDTP